MSTSKRITSTMRYDYEDKCYHLDALVGEDCTRHTGAISVSA